MTLAAAAMLLPAQSCLKEEKDVFETSSSARMQEYIQEVKDILLDGNKTWFLDYYAGNSAQYGGYSYVLKFQGVDQVVAASELDPEQEYTSLYKFTYDNGPVLSFDTNNPVLHYFATPSSTSYEAMHSDFEYMILSYSKEKIELLGKRSATKYILRPYDSEMTPLEYVAAVAENAENFCAPSFEGKIGETEVTGSVDVNNRWITIVYGSGEDDYTEAPFVFTNDGMRLYYPLVVDGCTIDYLWYVANNNLLTNGVFTLKGKLPDDYVPYSEFAGDFEFGYYNGTRTFNVTLTPTEDGSGYVMSGLNPNFTVNLTYDKGLGRLRWNTQVVGVDGSTTVYLAAWSLSGGGSLTWDTDTGVTIHWVESAGRFEFEDNGVFDSPVDSWILWGTDANGKSTGQFTGWGNSQIPYLTYMKKR